MGSGVYLDILDLDEVAADLQTPPTVVNDLGLDLSTEEGRAQLSRLLTSTFDGDTISPIPSCIEGHIVGEENIGKYCPKCRSTVMNLVDRPADATLWLAPPKGVIGFVHPEVWTILNSRMIHAKRFSMLEWVCDPHYRESYPELRREQEAYLKVHKRGINYFIENFESVLEWLMAEKRLVRFTNEGQRAEWLEFIRRNRSRFFPKMLPIMSRLFIVNEKSPMGLYSDETSREVPDAIYAVTCTDSLRLTSARRQSHAVRAITRLAKCANSIFREFIGGKWGLIRRQLIGSRLHFTARAVITSLAEVHRYNEIHTPWTLSIQLLRFHILAKLLKRGWMLDDAYGFIEDSCVKWNVEMRKILDELLAESIDGKGIPVILQRPPTLTRLSAMCLRITAIKDDIHDNTISMSTLILTGANADFDGDMLAMMLILDRRMLSHISRLEPHLGARSLRAPRKLSEFMKIHAPVAATMMNYYHEEDDSIVADG